MRFRHILKRSWTVRVTHIFREGNHMADHLANRGQGLNFGTHTMRLDDNTIQYWARYDAVGCEESRMIRAL
ncbi:Putative ribonuclease H protein At1g65750 [Linum perenne]